MPRPTLTTPLLLAVLFLNVLSLVSCGPKKDNSAIAALKHEKNAWEQESNKVAEDATAGVQAASNEADQGVTDE